MQFEKHKKALAVLMEIDQKPENYLIIHYSCESFYNIKDGRTPRITSIAVYSFNTAQTESFSIHKVAEKEHIKLNDIENNYDSLEKKMLEEFYIYVKENLNMIWLHWNMRDINYGFKAIEHRYHVLGGEPVTVPDHNKIDISRLFIQCYGVNYINHPRLEKLIELNNIRAKDFLRGAEEAIAFDNKEYIKLHQSTLRKVDVFANLLNRAIDRKLKVQSKWYDQVGFSIQSIFEYFSKKWYMQLIWTIISLFLGAYIGRKIGT